MFFLSHCLGFCSALSQCHRCPAPAGPQRVHPAQAALYKVAAASLSSCTPNQPENGDIFKTGILFISDHLVRRFKLSTFLKNAGHPLLVEGDPGVPVGDSVAAPEPSRNDPDQGGVPIGNHSQRTPVVTSAGSAEMAASLIVYSLRDKF